jgi:hypothetical protein
LREQNDIGRQGANRELDLINQRMNFRGGDPADDAMLHLEDDKAFEDGLQKLQDAKRKEKDIELEHERFLKQQREQRVKGVYDMLGNLAIIAEAYGKKGLIAYRVFASAQVVMDTARAAMAAFSSLAGIPYVGPVLGTAAAAAAVGAGAAQIAKINGAFMEGGYTGDIGTSQVAGVVHGREFVIPANRVSEFGVDFFEGIRTGEIRPAEAAAGRGGSGGGMTANFARINTRNEMREFMASEGWKIVYDETSKRQRRV